MKHYTFADLHLHPNLKTFGHSFNSEKKILGRQHVWYHDPPSTFTKLLNRLTGLTKFSQADFTTLAKGNVRIVFVSLYPFEKGFFINGSLNGPLSACLANIVTGIGYKRIRHLQIHTDYFDDLIKEYSFFANSCKSFVVEGKTWAWQFAANWEDVEAILSRDYQIAVIPTIEGAHVLNCGLSAYGKATQAEEVLTNVASIKSWKFPPLFITLAHNFNNDLCGHARSLERLGQLVDQQENLDGLFTDLGYRVVEALLQRNKGRRILIDVKHMSLRSRLKYYQLVETTYGGKIPIVVSHGGVAGQSYSAPRSERPGKSFFVPDDINFFDEELVVIARTGGCFALQLDGSRLAARRFLRKGLLGRNLKEGLKLSADIVWAHLQHIAEVLDEQGLSAWDTATIGSDFDGTINPLESVWTAAYLPQLAGALESRAREYLIRPNRLKIPENKAISPEEVIGRFTSKNALNFLKTNFTL